MSWNSTRSSTCWEYCVCMIMIGGGWLSSISCICLTSTSLTSSSNTPPAKTWTLWWPRSPHKKNCSWRSSRQSNSSSKESSWRNYSAIAPKIKTITLFASITISTKPYTQRITTRKAHTSARSSPTTYRSTSLRYNAWRPQFGKNTSKVWLNSSTNVLCPET